VIFHDVDAARVNPEVNTAEQTHAGITVYKWNESLSAYTLTIYVPCVTCNGPGIVLVITSFRPVSRNRICLPTSKTEFRIRNPETDLNWRIYLDLLISLVSMVDLTPWSHNHNHRIHKSPSRVPILSQPNPLYPPANHSKIHSNSKFPSTPRSYEWSLSFRLLHQNLVHFSVLSHACHMPRPAHLPCLDLLNYIWG
jgi:hypothetical protein